MYPEGQTLDGDIGFTDIVCLEAAPYLLDLALRRKTREAALGIQTYCLERNFLGYVLEGLVLRAISSKVYNHNHFVG